MEIVVGNRESTELFVHKSKKPNLFVFLPTKIRITPLKTEPLMTELEAIVIKIAQEFGVGKLEVFYDTEQDNPPPPGN